ncbi:MAG: YqgE/AlgH family protein [Maioricimonas sp. JB049]
MFESLRGHFLIAGCRLKDRNFFKTAVLIVEHSPEGAMGLVINRPSSVSVANALSGHLDLPDTEELVYVGGPVEPAALFILHNAANLDPSEAAVLSSIYVGSSADIFEEVVRSAIADSDIRFRIYSGCAGWGPGQLEGELARGDWMTLKATEDAIFCEDPYQVWDQLLARVYATHRLLPHVTENPEWN